MQGLSITFSKTGATLNTTESVSDFATLAQNGLVNIATQRGTDPIYTTRGTLIYEQGVFGNITTYNAAYHAANFAALDTLFFLRESDYEEIDYERIDKIILEPKEFSSQYLSLNASFTGDQGTTIGIQVDNL